VSGFAVCSNSEQCSSSTEGVSGEDYRVARILLLGLANSAVDLTGAVVPELQEALLALGASYELITAVDLGIVGVGLPVVNGNGATQGCNDEFVGIVHRDIAGCVGSAETNVIMSVNMTLYLNTDIYLA
jgi:hypothetical protein